MFLIRNRAAGVWTTKDWGNTPEAARSGVVLAQAGSLLLFSRPPVVPTPRIPMRRIPHQSGKEAASNVPSWARGFPHFVGETPRQYAERLMDQQFGRGSWRSIPERERDFRQIQKFGARAFRDPLGLLFGLPDDPEA